MVDSFHTALIHSARIGGDWWGRMVDANVIIPQITTHQHGVILGCDPALLPNLIMGDKGRDTL